MNKNLRVVVLSVAVGLIGISVGIIWIGNNSKQISQEQSDMITIDSSGLNSGSENKLIFNMALRNKSSVAQKYPLLELTLLDRADNAVARRVIKLDEFLGANEDRQIPASDTKSIVLQIDASEVPEKDGYRAFVFYEASEPEHLNTQINPGAISVLSGGIHSVANRSANLATGAEPAVSSDEVNTLKMSADDGRRNNWFSQGYGVNEDTRVFCAVDRFGKITVCNLDILGRASTGEKSAPIWSFTQVKECGSKDPDILQLNAFEGPMSPVRIFFDDETSYIETRGVNKTDIIHRFVEDDIGKRLQKAKLVKVVHSVRNGHEISFKYDMIGYNKALSLITAACK